VDRTVTKSETITVVIVDDHPLLREGLAAVFEGDPAFEVVGEASSVREAIAEIGRLQPTVAVVDLNLPDGSGADVCAHVQAAHPRVRLLVLTRYSAERMVLNAFNAGAHGFALKSAAPEWVREAVRLVAANEIYVDPQVAQFLVKAATRGRRVPGPYGLTSQELRVLGLVAEGKTNPEIGHALGLSIDTVKTHLRHATQKLGVDDRRSAAEIVMQEGIV
jgi:DNA-binding NarL/FixJ family response regulator